MEKIISKAIRLLAVLVVGALVAGCDNVTNSSSEPVSLPEPVALPGEKVEVPLELSVLLDGKAPNARTIYPQGLAQAEHFYIITFTSDWETPFGHTTTVEIDGNNEVVISLFPTVRYIPEVATYTSRDHYLNGVPPIARGTHEAFTLGANKKLFLEVSLSLQALTEAHNKGDTSSGTSKGALTTKITTTFSWSDLRSVTMALKNGTTEHVIDLLSNANHTMDLIQGYYEGRISLTNFAGASTDFFECIWIYDTLESVWDTGSISGKDFRAKPGSINAHFSIDLGSDPQHLTQIASVPQESSIVLDVVDDGYEKISFFVNGQKVQEGTSSSYMLDIAPDAAIGSYEWSVVGWTKGIPRSTSARFVVTPQQEVYTVHNEHELRLALESISIAPGVNFTIIIAESFFCDPFNIGADLAGKRITIESDAFSSHIISLGRSGSLITVNEGVSLIVNELTLQGRSDNTASLVKVNGGTLILNTGAKITGNTYRATFTETFGGGLSIYHGTLEIAGGEVYDNKVSFSGSGNYYDLFGGGIYAENSKVRMSAGAIRGNQVVSNTTGDAHGMSGGLHLKNTVFELSGGNIEGNTVSVKTSMGIIARGGGITATGESIFRMTGGKVRDNHITVSGGNFWTSASGGGIFSDSESRFKMVGGVISGNSCTSSEYNHSIGNNYYFGAYGGGVISNNMIKTGGIIYGHEVLGNDADGFPLKNTATTSGGEGQGHAVLYRQGSEKSRNTTAYETDNIDSTLSGRAGGWEG
jgi:hypothetical protein